MSGIEIGIGVVSAVAALIAAYKDGHKIADRIKKKRAQRGAPPSSEELEKALKKGETNITRLGDEGSSVKIDDQAAQALKDLIIEVQGSLLHRLAEAEQDDTIVDFSSVTKTAIRTRRQAETLLNNLYLRAEQNQALEAETTTAPPSPEVSRQPTVRTVEEDGPRENRLRFWRRSTTTQDRTRNATPLPSPSTAPPSPNITRQSTALSDITHRSTSVTSPTWSAEAIHPITEERKYAGFCKGAWRAQRYEFLKAVKSSVKSFERKYHCTKCSYMLPADMSDKNHPRFDDRIYTLGEMRFRMLFLLKSHIPQKNSKDLRQYGCTLCTLAGQPARQFTGEGHLLEHTSRHQFQVLGDIQLVGPLSIESDGVRTDTAEDFDILFDRGQDFALPPSMMEDNQSLQSLPLELPEDIFGNVWADQRRGGEG